LVKQVTRQLHFLLLSPRNPFCLAIPMYVALTLTWVCRQQQHYLSSDPTVRERVLGGDRNGSDVRVVIVCDLASLQPGTVFLARDRASPSGKAAGLEGGVYHGGTNRREASAIRRSTGRGNFRFSPIRAAILSHWQIPRCRSTDVQWCQSR